ncbi:MAG TPA: hypothetical protein EYG58_06775 [Nitrospirales bacterium]|nr:hypothetical protein [Nitrospirales bacterium]
MILYGERCYMRVRKKEVATVWRLNVWLVVTLIVVGYVGCADITSQPTAPISVQPLAQNVPSPKAVGLTRSMPSVSRSTPPISPIGSPEAGTYWALIIGIDQYADQNIPTLQTAVQDAEGVRDVLTKRYGFKPRNIVMLLNDDATRINIEEALLRVGEQTGEKDSVLVYYAGHGQYSSSNRLGWWVPSEARGRTRGTFINNATIRDYLGAMQARHVYLIADSCFSGTLFASTRGNFGADTIDDKYYRRLSEQRSRWGFTSGGVEPVADGGKDGHSIFAYHFIKFLNENTNPYVVPSGIADTVIPLVTRVSEQLPRSQPLYGAGDEGGQFLLRLASYVPKSESTEVPVDSLQVTEQIRELQNALSEALTLLRGKETSAQNEKRDLRRELEEQRQQIDALTMRFDRSNEYKERATPVEDELKKTKVRMRSLTRVRAEEETERAKEEATNFLRIGDLEDQLQATETKTTLVAVLTKELAQANKKMDVFAADRARAERVRGDEAREHFSRVRELENQIEQIKQAHAQELKRHVNTIENLEQTVVSLRKRTEFLPPVIVTTPAF